MKKGEILEILERILMDAKREIGDSAATYGRTVDEQVEAVAEGVVLGTLTHMLDTVRGMR